MIYILTIIFKATSSSKNCEKNVWIQIKKSAALFLFFNQNS